MSSFVIITDSTSDLGKNFQERFGIVMLDGHIVLPDGKEIPAFTEWTGMSREEFYADLKKNPDGYKTSPPNVNQYYEAFKKYTDEGKGVLAITLSGGISGAYGFMSTAMTQVMFDNPKARIYCIDSRKFGPSVGLLIIKAAQLRDEGRSLEETADIIEKIKFNLHQAGWLDDLSFVAKKGRISHTTALMGTLVGVKPLGEFDSNGLTTVVGKVKGAKAAYKTLIKYMEQTIIEPEKQIIFIAQSCRLKQAEEFKALIWEHFNPKELYINDVFPACGANIGPGLMAAYYFGTELTSDLSKEKEIMKKIINED